MGGGGFYAQFYGTIFYFCVSSLISDNDYILWNFCFTGTRSLFWNSRIKYEFAGQHKINNPRMSITDTRKTIKLFFLVNLQLISFEHR